jgi:hypothetical protein
MEIAYQGEIATPSRCGRMDQGCAYGNRPVLMTFDGDRLDTTELGYLGKSRTQFDGRTSAGRDQSYFEHARAGTYRRGLGRGN